MSSAVSGDTGAMSYSMLRWVLVGSLALSAGVFGCSSDSGGDDTSQSGGGSGAGTGSTAPISCRYSNCPGEVVLYDKEEQCQALMMAPCYAEHKAWNDCRLANEQCDGDGKIILSSVETCKDLSTTLNDCLAAAM